MNDIKGQKLDAKGDEVCFIGFNILSLRSNFVVAPTGKVIESKNVHFLKKENSPPLESDEPLEILSDKFIPSENN